ncbi:MAG: hypothetical protein DRG25_05445 [Deltaproteobacteria bacterium]|nr:MAG: hypothetical protein DRG25_05445 [Deltaproteobacteria bacterium]
MNLDLTTYFEFVNIYKSLNYSPDTKEPFESDFLKVKMRISRLALVFISITLLFSPILAWSEDNHGFTQKDRELLVALKVRMEEMDKRFEQRFQEIDKRFEQMDRRFEQVDRRFEFIQNLLIAMLGVFGGLCGVFVGLLLWDRKTFKDKAKEEAIREIEEKSRVMKALKKYSEVEPKMADVLRSLGLL